MVTEILTSHFYKTVWHKLTRTSRFIEQSDRVLLGNATSVWLKMNLTSFLVWRLKLKIWTGHPPVSDFSTYYIPSEPQDTARQSFVLPLLSDQNWQSNRGRENRQRVILVNSDLGVPSQALIHPFLLYSCYLLVQPIKLKGCGLHFLLLPGNTSMFPVVAKRHHHGCL